MKKIILFFISSLLISSLATAQTTLLLENFDAGIPGTWTIVDAGAATGDSWFSSTSRPLDGTATALVDSDAFGNGTQLIETLESPVINASASNFLYLEFDQWYNNIGADSAIVQVFDGTAWQTILSYNADVGAQNNPDHPIVDVSAYANANFQVRFVYDDANVWAWYWSVDNVYIYEVNCPTPGGLDTANVATTTADLLWTDASSSGDYLVEYGPAGFTPGTGAGTVIAATGSPLSILGLTSETNYDFYVSTICGGVDTSATAGPFSFQTAVSCPIPTSVVLDSLEPTFIELSWIENGSATEWEIEYGPVGFTPGTGAGMVVSALSNPFLVTGLSQATNYDVYVRAVCAAGDTSSYSAVTNFFTPCGVQIAPWFDNVESQVTGTVSPCWSRNSNNTYQWLADNLGTPSGGTGPLVAYSGANYFYTEASSGTTNDTANLLTPDVDITALGSPYLSFYYHMAGATINALYIDVYDGNSWVNGVDSLIGPQQAAQADPWQNRLVDLGAFAGSPVISVRFRALRGSSFTGDIAIDDISILNISCFPVSLLDTANVAATSADLSWTDPNGTSAWEIEYGPTGFALGTGNTVIANSNPFTVTGLVPQTDYEFYVRAICSPGDSSLWAGPSTSFLTPVADYDISFNAFLEPTSGCGDSTSNIVVVIGNNGLSQPLSTDIDVLVSGDATGSYNINYSGAGIPNFGDLDTIVMGTVNTYAGGTINFTGIVFNPLDVNNSNDTLQYSVNMISIEPVGYDISVCDADTAWLSAYAGYGYNWYDAASGGNLVGVGDSLFVPSISAQGTYYLEYTTGTSNSLQTTYAAGNGQNGNMFDVTTVSNTTIIGFNCNVDAAAGTAVTIEVYYIQNASYVGNETNAAAWTLEGSYSLTGAGTGNPTNVTLATGVPLVAGQNTAIYVTTTGTPNVAYTNGNGTNQFYTDGTISVTLGAGKSYPFGSTFTPRVFNGDIIYQGASCSSIRTAVTATAGTSPFVDLGADTSYCEGTPFFIGVGTATDSYNWSTGDSSQTIQVTATGSYSVTATDAVGCSSADSINLVQNPLPVAGFFITANSLTVTMTNSASNADSVVYDFGDGTVSSDPNATHTYAGDSTYTICQTVYNSCGADTSCQTSAIVSISTFEDGSSIAVFPNPNKGDFVLHMALNQEQEVYAEILSVDGKRIFEKAFGTIHGQINEQISLENIPSGLYFVKVRLGDEISTQKIIIRD